MTPNTRKFLVGSAFVVSAGLCTGLVAYYSGALPGRAPRTEFSYIPADVSAVAFADVRDIMDSEFSQRVRDAVPTGAEKGRLLEETGIDIERDIDTVLAGISGNGPGGALVVMRGRFDVNRIESLAVQHGAQQEQYGGRSMLVGLSTQAAPHAAVDGYVPSLAFLDDGLLAIGDAGALRKAIDVAAGGQDLGTNPDMMRFVTSVQGTGNAWMVGRADQVTRQPQLPDQFRSQVEAIEWVSISADIGRDVRGVIRAETRDEESGQQLRTVVAGALAAARMFGEQDARLASLLGAVQASGAGRNVELSFAVSPAVLDLIKTAAHGPAPELPAPAVP